MKILNCWEFMNCPNEIKEQCIVFELDSGKECWMFHDFENNVCRCKQSLEKCNCLNCPYYTKFHLK